MLNNSTDFLTNQESPFSPKNGSSKVTTTIQISWVLLGFVSAALNILVCSMVYFDRKLRTTTNYFVVSLSIADLLVSVVFIPVDIAEHYTKTKSGGYFVAFILLASIFNLCAVTYERYIGLTRPLQYKQIIDCRKLCIVLLVSWISPLLLALLPLAWAANSETALHKVYLGIIIGVFIIAPCTVMVCIYIRLLRTIRRYLLRNRQRSTRGNHTGLRAGREEKSVKVFAMILGSFLLCWLPLVYINICDIMGLVGFTSQTLVYVSFYTLVLNSIFDPLIYALCKKDFKRSLRKLLAAKCFGQERPGSVDSSSRRVSSFSRASKIVVKKETML